MTGRKPDGAGVRGPVAVLGFAALAALMIVVTLAFSFHMLGR